MIEEVIHGVEGVVHRATHRMFEWVIVGIIAFFVLLAWYQALQGWVVYWFTEPSKERDALRVRTSAYTVFAAFATLFLIVVDLYVRS